MNVLMFNWADYAIVGIVVLSIIVSLIRGFVREALSLVTWAVAFWVSFSFAGTLSSLMVNYIHSNSLREIASFGFLFVATLLLGAFVNFLITQLIDKTGLSGTDRVLGVVFGGARGILLIALILMLAGLTPMPQDDWWKQSVLIPQFKPLQVWLQGFLPPSMTQHLQLSY